MLDNLFKNKIPFAYEYFSNLLELVFQKKRTFPQALIFEGNDTKTQYLFALELARILNCQNDKSKDCNCINCKWIKSFAHPAVNNVSQIHFKGENDESKTVISVKQAREIEKNLSLSSDYYRFFIFFSSSEKEYFENELNDFKNLGYETNINYSIQPLEYKTFHSATLNAMLKSIEEPPENTVFIFLTKSKEDILPTIVSRCLVFKLSGHKESLNWNDIKGLLSNYPNITYDIAFDISDNIQKYLKETNLDCELFLNKFLEYLKDILRQNINNNDLAIKINKDIRLINDAIKHTRANISEKITLDTLMLRIARGF